jgi:predicted O-methyltransferase YrrM
MREFLKSVIRPVYYFLVGPQIRKRRAYRNSMPYVKLSDDHTSSATVLPNRERLLELMQRDGVVAEIGVANGDFSEKIMEICHPKKLHLIDAWHTTTYADGKQMVEHRFTDKVKIDQVVVHQGLSTCILSGFADGSLDWVYIDTNHSYETTANELLECARIIRPGGLIAGHDFCLGNIVKPAVFGVIQAVNEFCVLRSWRYKYITIESNGHFSFCLEQIPGI